MKTANDTITGESKTNLSLHELVDDIIKKASLETKYNKSSVKNDVDPGVHIKANEDMVASVIEGLLNAMITNATEGDIHISAKELFGNTIKVYVKDSNCYNTYAVACGLQKILPLAERIGGCLNITNQRQKITTIEFSFPVAKEEDRSAYDD